MYQSIDMHCIVVLVKFDDWLSILFLRKKQISTKKVPIFKNISSPAKWEMDRAHPLGKSYIFLASHFSPEWNRQPAFKLNMDLDVLLIYRLIPRTHGLLGYIATFGTLQSVAFLRLLGSVCGPIGHTMHGFRYHAIATHYIVLYVKFDGGLSISVLRNRQLFTKLRGSKVYIFKKVYNFKNRKVSEHRPQKVVGHFESVETS
jgi:hypothetical protein